MSVESPGAISVVEPKSSIGPAVCPSPNGPLAHHLRHPGPIRLRDRILPSRYFLAPLAGYTNLALRQTIREVGGLGLATTDLVNARALLQASRKTYELIATCPEDRPTAVQIYGSEAQYLCEAAQWLVARGYEIIDINMGCPVNKVTKGGGGS